MAYTDPSVDDFKDYFYRDFPYTDDEDDLTKVQDRDIERALADAGFNTNQGLFTSQERYTTGFLLLSAHFLVMNLRASTQGLAGSYAWLESSKSVGSVSASSSIPERILANPELAMLSKTNYGAQYLLMILPLLTGQIFSVCGATLP